MRFNWCSYMVDVRGILLCRVPQNCLGENRETTSSHQLTSAMRREIPLMHSDHKMFGFVHASSFRFPTSDLFDGFVGENKAVCINGDYTPPIVHKSINWDPCTTSALNTNMPFRRRAWPRKRRSGVMPSTIGCLHTMLRMHLPSSMHHFQSPMR